MATKTADKKINYLFLENHRSWRKTKLEFHPGLNVITGTSDSGKSNIVRAFKSLVDNDTAGSFVLDEAQSPNLVGKVSLKLDSNETVQLSKGIGVNVKTNQYRVYSESTGEWRTYTSIGTGVCEPARDTCAIGPRVLGGREVYLNIAGQRDGAFIVDESPGDIAKIIGSISGLDVVFRASVQANDIRRKANSAAEHSRFEFNKWKAEYNAARNDQQYLDDKKCVGEAERALLSAEQCLGVSSELRAAIELADTCTATLRAIDLGCRDIESHITEASRHAANAVAVQQSSAELSALIDQADECFAVINSCNVTIEAATNRIKHLEQELATLKVCPTCGKAM